MKGIANDGCTTLLSIGISIQEGGLSVAKGLQGPSCQYVPELPYAKSILVRACPLAMRCIIPNGSFVTGLVFCILPTKHFFFLMHLFPLCPHTLPTTLHYLHNSHTIMAWRARLGHNMHELCVVLCNTGERSNGVRYATRQDATFHVNYSRQTC